MSATPRPTWYAGEYGCRQDMYAASVALPIFNQHDALVAKVAAAEAARLLLSDAIRKYAAGVEHQRSVMEAAKKALDTLNAALGATS